jgi:hypothetical protein
MIVFQDPEHHQLADHLDHLILKNKMETQFIVVVNHIKRNLRMAASTQQLRKSRLKGNI